MALAVNLNRNLKKQHKKNKLSKKRNNLNRKKLTQIKIFLDIWLDKLSRT